jgi:hypothetical protein
MGTKAKEHENTDGAVIARRLGNTGHKTGFWFEEFAASYLF